MHAVQLAAVNELKIASVPDPQAAPGEAIVRLRAAALNHRDVWIKLGQYAGLKFPCIPGSDGAGVVESVGAGVDAAWLGREVIINPALDWGSRESAQGEEFSILGLPRDGTLAEKVAVPAANLAPKPAHLTWEEAAALPLAGLTAYRALSARAGLKADDRVLITGIGGGVALFALQLAVALGAAGGANYKEAGWAAALAKAHGPFDVIVDSVGGEGFNDLVELAASGGRIVFYGATSGNPSGVALRKIFWRQLSLLGSTMGSPCDFAGMLDFVALHRLKPVVSDVFPLARAGEAFALMERGGQFGKIVVTP
ncbi:MAG TPA: zinc-binding dehydrogenase [Opitutaceae bacterium]|jgi:zinc-binding alcohol dehydrogenase/oxidoreductase|nr:zinc-binding dehydrogenase [Opitutaceae bacterium]